MKQAGKMTGRVDYGRKLINAGVSGIRTGDRSSLGGRSSSEIFADSALDSLKVAAAGACVALVGYSLTARRNRLPKTLVCGAIGFCAAFAWRTRKVVRTLGGSAVREIHKASDQHWLEKHPINYA